MKHIYKLALFIIVLVVMSLQFGSKSQVNAWSCGNCSGGCYPLSSSLGGNEKWCSRGDCGASVANCSKKTQNGNCKCNKGGPVTCSNVAYVCPKNCNPPPVTTKPPTPTSCSCTDVACPGTGASKFKQASVASGTATVCSADRCSKTHPQCYVNTNSPPSCSILPTSIEMTREDSPKTISITATDADWGDSVSIRAVKVVDTVGNLNSCVTLKTLGGGFLDNAVIRLGTDNPAATSQTTQFLVDARESHGVFGIGSNGASVCEGKIIVEIVDVGAGGDDVPTFPYPTCSVNIKVTNEAPKLTDVKILDQDTMSTVRESGNLIDGRDQLFVGSLLTTQTKARASSCSKPLNPLDPIKCLGGDEKYAGYSDRRNPFQLEFTVSDANGRNDIMQAGVWIQNVAQNNNSIAFPLTSGSGVRNSFQALYSEKENIQIVDGDARSYFLSRACLGTNCGPQELSTSSKQVFSTLAFINDLSDTVIENGNIKIGKKQWATQKSWQKVGFPDCLNFPAGCSLSNIPANGTSVATTTDTTYSNYDWAISADASHMLCFKSDSSVPTVVAVSTPVICPVDCAACAKKEGAVASATDPNAITFKFGIYFNDADSGSGMPAGDYAVFISGLDKVSAPLNNVAGRGDEGWVKFNKNGALCSGAACANGTDFVLNYDPVAPVVDSAIVWKATAGAVSADVKISDNTGGSGIGGVTNQFMAYQTIQEGEPLDDRRWAPDESGNDFDGKDRQESLSSDTTKVTLKGTGLSLTGGEEVVAGVCAYDRAGNMGCGRNGLQYVFLAPWLKTSYGDIFSAKGGDASVPFAQTLPNIDSAITDRTAGLYSPFNEQIYTVGTGLLMTSGNSGIGITGGYSEVMNKEKVQTQLGFKGNYRFIVSSQYNIFGYSPLVLGNEYERLHSTAILNCDLLNSAQIDTCQTGTTVAAISSKKYNVVTLNGGTISTPLECTGANTIFVTGPLTISSNVTKTNAESGCIFVISGAGSLTISDTFSGSRNTPATGYGSPSVDKFEAAVVANAGAKIEVTKGIRGTTTTGLKSSDRLEIKGWVYSSDITPVFKRDLIPGDNRRYPAEWIVYDASLLDVLRPLLGTEKTADLTCGTSSHVLCVSDK